MEDRSEIPESQYIDNVTLNSLKGLQIVQYNVRSLFHKIDTIRHDFLMPSIDLLCLSETWLNEDLPDELINIDDFQLLRNDRKYGRGGGTCIYIRNRLKFVNDLIVVNDKDVEIQGVHIGGGNEQHPQKQILLVVVYRPPRGNSRIACDKIKSFVYSVDNLLKKEIILVGDFNWNCGVEQGVGLNFVGEIETDLGLEQLINCPTRIGSNSESTIDLVFSNITNILGVGCLTGTFSDHFPTYLIKKRSKVNVEMVEVRRRNMRKYDRDVFCEKIEKLDWSLLDILVDVNEMWIMIYKAIVYELNFMCPYTFFKIRKYAPLWFSKYLVCVARERDRLWDKYRKGGRRNHSLYENAVKKRREFNSLVKKAKKDFFVEKLTQYGNDQIMFWKTINGLLGGRNPPAIERVFKPGEEELCSLEESVSIINEFFAQIGDRVASNIEQRPFRQRDKQPLSVMESFTDLTEVGLLKILSELSTKKSSG